MKKLSTAEMVQHLWDIHEVSNLMSMYEYKLAGSQFEDVVAMFASKTPGVRAEIGNWGVYEGVAGIQRLFGELHKRLQTEGNPPMPKKGMMFLLPNTNPVIEVARDGKTARGLWMCTGNETKPVQGKYTGMWAWAKRATDFVKEDGQWKIWHYRVYGLFMTPYDKCWTELEDPDYALKNPVSDELPPDRPSTYHWSYSPSARYVYIPAAPEPYDTFDENNSY
jgi:hypothetical protein